MKNCLHTPAFNARGCGLTRINLHSQPQKLSFMDKRNVVHVVESSENYSFKVLKTRTLNVHLYIQQLQSVHKKNWLKSALCSSIGKFCFTLQYKTACSKKSPKIWELN